MLFSSTLSTKTPSEEYKTNTIDSKAKSTTMATEDQDITHAADQKKEENSRIFIASMTPVLENRKMTINLKQKILEQPFSKGFHKMSIKRKI